jgi:mannosyltransferase
MVGLAVVVGAALRFHRLGAVSMTADEGAAWAVAAEPVGRLVQLQPQLDSGKLALYHLVLHYWMRFFGDRLGVIRGLSAILGTIAIGLIFLVVWELSQTFGSREDQSAGLAAGFAALLFATNVGLIQSARCARMYPLMTAAGLAQMLFFIRAHRSQNVWNCILSALFLALAIAANFTALFLIVGESSWLACLLIERKVEARHTQICVAAPALSLVAGGVLLLPFLPGAVSSSQAAVKGGALNWIPSQPFLRWSFEVLRTNVGNKPLFMLLAALSAFGIWHGRVNRVQAPSFMAHVMVGCFAAVGLLSAIITPLTVERYVIMAQIAFLALAALGVAALRSRIAAVAVIVVIGWLSVRAVRHWSGFWVDWKSATAIACINSPRDAAIGVIPEYAVNAVRYYLPRERRAHAFGIPFGCGNSRLLLLSPGRFLSAQYMSQLYACYPHVLGQATRVEIRAR